MNFWLLLEIDLQNDIILTQYLEKFQLTRLTA